MREYLFYIKAPISAPESNKRIEKSFYLVSSKIPNGNYWAELLFDCAKNFNQYSFLPYVDAYTNDLVDLASLVKSYSEFKIDLQNKKEIFGVLEVGMLPTTKLCELQEKVIINPWIFFVSEKDRIFKASFESGYNTKKIEIILCGMFDDNGPSLECWENALLHNHKTFSKSNFSDYLSAVDKLPSNKKYLDVEELTSRIFKLHQRQNLHQTAASER